MVESKFIENGGLNTTYEESLLHQLQDWFEQRGGRLLYSQPSLSKTEGYRLLASEDIHDKEVILSTPIALTMCRISARNVVIANKSKYLGEELKKTFERNEVWNKIIFF